MHKPITVINPEANAMIEQLHCVLGIICKGIDSKIKEENSYKNLSICIVLASAHVIMQIFIYLSMKGLSLSHRKLR